MVIGYQQLNKGQERIRGSIKNMLQISRYNILLVNIKESLVELHKGIKGLVVMSDVLENIFHCIFEGVVPSTWLKSEYSLVSIAPKEHL